VPVLLEASALTVVRGRRTVLSGVSLELSGGRAVQLTGVNGSGKTSLLRVLAGLTTPRAGRVVRGGACAFVPEKVVLSSAMRAGEWLAAMRRLRGLAAVDWPAATVASGLDADVLARSSATFSKGMLQRIALLEALHSGCPLLLLDEPFAGLDPDGRDWVGRRLVAALAEGAAVLLTDHSGAARERLPLAAELHVPDGELIDADRASRPPAGAVTVTASHPDGRRLERTVAEGAGDDLLRELLAGGWHIEAVRR
jgi:ABC-type multidrug transport system ATPase subunit